MPAIEPLVEPIFDYGRGRGQSVTGGYVYRGAALPARVPRPLFLRRLRQRPDLVARPGQSNPETREASVVDETEHTDDLGGAVAGLASFARDRSGEVYVVTHGGDIYRLAPEAPAADGIADGEPPRRRPLY